MTPPPSHEDVAPQLSDLDVARIVRCLRVVVRVVDSGEASTKKVTIAGIIWLLIIISSYYIIIFILLIQIKLQLIRPGYQSYNKKSKTWNTKVNSKPKKKFKKIKPQNWNLILYFKSIVYILIYESSGPSNGGQASTDSLATNGTHTIDTVCFQYHHCIFFKFFYSWSSRFNIIIAFL